MILCEPICRGFEHAPFNAAFIDLLRRSNPAESLVFLAERTHLDEVNRILVTHQSAPVAGSPISMVSADAAKLTRLAHGIAICQEAIDQARRTDGRLIFTSIATPTLVAVKVLLRLAPSVKAVIVPHGILESLVSQRRWRPSWFSLGFRWGELSRLRYLVLGESIRQQLKSLQYSTRAVLAIDHPYFFEPPRDYGPFEGGKIQFASLGVGHRGKGTDRFISLARELANSKAGLTPEFSLIGPLVDPTIDLEGAPVQLHSPGRALSRSDFESRVRGIDYAVFLYRPTSYRLTASGAFFDALSFLKPIITLKNSFFSYYFGRFGDIGYLCESEEHVRETIQEVLYSPPRERYKVQQANLLRARAELTAGDLTSLEGFWRGQDS